MNRKVAAITGLGILVGAMYFVMGPGQETFKIEQQIQPTETPISTPNAPATTTDTATTAVPQPQVEANPQDLQKIKTFDTIVESKNDNDPRLDTEFRNLTDGTKWLLQSRYKNLAPEKRNEKGTAVFLLGRELKTKADFDFLGQVLAEPPCLSLENCAKGHDSIESSDDHHLDAATDVTLAYPQMVALKSLERVLSEEKTDQIRIENALRQVTLAKNSPISRVSSLAEEILKRYLQGRK